MASGERGFTLVEVLVALFLTGLGLLAIAPLFVYASESSATSADLGVVGAKAVQRLEILRAQGFGTLAAGGSLTSNVAGFSDTTDAAVTVRWTVAHQGSPPARKLITVRARAQRRVVGLEKVVTMTTLRSR
jgi:prepilin-type N-terminal cleavage/methylation domain-containing protein